MLNSSLLLMSTSSLVVSKLADVRMLVMMVEWVAAS